VSTDIHRGKAFQEEEKISTEALRQMFENQWAGRVVFGFVFTAVLGIELKPLCLLGTPSAFAFTWFFR
jgi:hypothetical protein